MVDRSGAHPATAQVWLEDWLLPAGATLLAFGLALFELEAKSLWFDELATLTGAGWQGTWLDAIRLPLTIPTTPKPPLSYLVNHAFLLLGDGVFLLRLPAVLFATLTIPLLFALGKAFFGRRVGWIGAYLLAVAPLHVRYAQEMRMYAMLTFLTLLSLYLFWRAICVKDWRWWLGFAVTSTLALYTHLVALLPLGVMVLFGLWRLVRPWPERFPFSTRHFVLSVASIALVYLPLVPFLLQGLAGPEGLGSGAAASWDLGTLLAVQRLFSSGTGLGALLYAVLAALAAGLLAARRHEALGLIALWLVLPVLAILLAPFGHGVRARYFLSGLPVYLLLVAYGLNRAGQGLVDLATPDRAPARRRSQLKAFLTALFLLLVAGISLPALRAYYAETKQNWRDATWLALDLAQPGEAFYVRHLYHQVGVRYYAGQRAAAAGWTTPPEVRLIPRDWEQGFPPDSGDRSWLVVPVREDLMPGGSFDAGIQPAYRLQPPYLFEPAHIPKEAGILAPVNYGALAVVPVVRAEPVAARFWVEEARLDPGACTLLHWEVRNVQAVYLDGRGVAGVGQQPVCPPIDTTYRLEVVQLDGTRAETTLAVSVNSP